jgi:hypothetical protein
MIKIIRENHKPITPAECASIVLDVLQFYWESSMDAAGIARLQSLWYEVLKEHSRNTIQTVAMDWLKNAKRKPTPAEFLELANEIDISVEQVKRLIQVSNLPIEQPKDEWQPDGKMNGDPILLAKLMRFSQNNRIKFNEKDQLDYLSNGILPNWYVPEPTEQSNKDMPSRDELLFQMSPEARLAAIKPDFDWKR